MPVARTPVRSTFYALELEDRPSENVPCVPPASLTRNGLPVHEQLLARSASFRTGPPFAPGKTGEGKKVPRAYVRPGVRPGRGPGRRGAPGNSGPVSAEPGDVRTARPAFSQAL